jgi:hypothetical protein
MLTTTGAACRAITGELLEQLVDWIVDKFTDDHWSISQIKAISAQTRVNPVFGPVPPWHLRLIRTTNTRLPLVSDWPCGSQPR